MINRKLIQQLRAKKRAAKEQVITPPETYWLHTPVLNDPTRSESAMITIGMASIPAREAGMYAVLERLLPQCNRFDLSLNGYPPGYTVAIHSPKLNVYRNDNVVGPHGKLLNAHQTAGYFLTVDDDLIYPATYVQHMVAGIDKYRRQAYVGYHGNLIAERHAPHTGNIWCRCLFSHQDHLAHDIPVHMLGTGIFGYHSDAGRIDARKLLPGKIDDQVASWAQERRIPMVALTHPAMWVVEDKSLYLHGALRNDHKKSLDARKRINERTWHLYLPDNWGKYYR